MFAARDAGALSDAIAVMAGDAKMRIQVGQQGQASVFNDRNSRVMARTTGEVLVQIIENAHN